MVKEKENNSMSYIQEVHETFIRDIKNHTMDILKDDGVYRHLRFTGGGSSLYRFDILTWPGYLATVGDMKDLIFKRLHDMFDFFGGYDTTQPDGFKHINLDYWTEKIQGAEARDGVKNFDSELAEEFVENYIKELKDPDKARLCFESVDYYSGYNSFLNSFYDAISCANLDYYPDDLYMHTSRYRFHYIWALLAIQYGIFNYNQSKVITKD